jgi:Fic family protein
LRDLWTHGSTALEGNSLTLGETSFVLAEGLTVSGKPLKDHNEVVGHARALDLLHAMLRSGAGLGAGELFDLHRAVQTESVVDIYSPVGAWKTEPNGTHAVPDRRKDGKPTFVEYARPSDVPALMKDWLALLNNLLAPPPESQEDALSAYADLHIGFVRVHPFAGGNGRMARLLANLPVLAAGLPPILIDRTWRNDYLDCLSACSVAPLVEEQARQAAGTPLVAPGPELDAFRRLCGECWQASRDLVEEMRRLQAGRDDEARCPH